MLTEVTASKLTCLIGNWCCIVGVLHWLQLRRFTVSWNTRSALDALEYKIRKESKLHIVYHLHVAGELTGRRQITWEPEPWCFRWRGNQKKIIKPRSSQPISASLNRVTLPLFQDHQDIQPNWLRSVSTRHLGSLRHVGLSRLRWFRRPNDLDRRHQLSRHHNLFGWMCWNQVEQLKREGLVVGFGICNLFFL